MSISYLHTENIIHMLSSSRSLDARDHKSLFPDAYTKLKTESGKSDLSSCASADLEPRIISLARPRHPIQGLRGNVRTIQC